MRDSILRLDANEGRPALPAASLAARMTPETLRRYPDARALESALAERLGLPASRVLATAGADDAIDRAVRALAGPGGGVVSTEPSFVEYSAAAARSGSRYLPRSRPPGHPFPLGPVLDAVAAETAAGNQVLAIAASPDNPGGASLSAAEVGALAASGAPFLLDVAYAAFAEPSALGGGAFLAPLPDLILSTGSLSKSYGLAGLRIGWICGPESLVVRLRAAGPPFSLSSIAVVAALAVLESGAPALRDFVEEVRRERPILEAAIASRGAETWPGQANFACARVADPVGFAAALAREGILVRTWPGRPGFEGLVRITCPGDRFEFERLLGAIGMIPPAAPLGPGRSPFSGAGKERKE